MSDQPGAHNAQDQSEVIAFLLDPASHPGSDQVERLETHGNLVFLAGADAWKIKRAVRFPYMDFSTLDKRRVACEQEVAINRRFSPDLYLGCVPITRSAIGEIAFGGDGVVVEWAVHMRRFEQSSLLSHLATQGPISTDLAKSLADVVRASHAIAERDVRSLGSVPIRRLVESVCDSLRASGAMDGAIMVRLTEGLNAEINRVTALLDERASQGFVRRCHGDLHLANIVLWRGRPALYDAIEFDDAIATIDTLYDLAFLLMDLDRYGQRQAANIILNRYLWGSQTELDLKGLACLPLFLALRAGIRAMVTIHRAAQEQSEARTRDVERARAYVRAALPYVARPAPRLIAVGGLSGTGKTTLAAAIAPFVGCAPGAVHLRSDLERKAMTGVGELDRLPGDTYTKEASAHVYRILKEKAQIALAAGCCVVVDAVYADVEERRDIEAVAEELRVPFSGIWLTADQEALVSRVNARKNDASDATAEVVATQMQYDIGPMSPTWITIDASGTPSETLSLASSLLALEP